MAVVLRLNLGPPTEGRLKVCAVVLKWNCLLTSEVDASTGASAPHPISPPPLGY